MCKYCMHTKVAYSGRKYDRSHGILINVENVFGLKREFRCKKYLMQQDAVWRIENVKVNGHFNNLLILF